MIIQIKSLLILFLFKCYSFFKLTYFINLIEYLGGPLFVKIFQSFNNFNNLQVKDDMNGTIGIIEKDKNIIRKSLHNNIKSNMEESFTILKYILKLNNTLFPFNFDDYYKINLEQLDLNKEREYSLILKDMFKNIENVNIINIYFSTKEYHLSYFIDAYPINVFLDYNPEYRTDIINLLYLSYYLMLSNNIFHCDWHFGNFLVKLDSNSKIILYILDTGLMGKLDNSQHSKLKILLTTNMLVLEPINLVKFLSFVNSNKEANIKKFIKDTKEIYNFRENNISYKNTIIKIIKNASKYNLKFPIVILYMFQVIIFLNNLVNDNLKGENNYNKLLIFSKKYGFYNEIQKTLN